MSSVPETYLYEVRPVGRPIVLGHGIEIKTRKSLYLTKEDVLKCLETAYVYRRFALREPERVTISNIDRVHRQVYISESEWDKLKDDENAAETTDMQCANYGEISDELPVAAEQNKEVEESIEITEKAADPESESEILDESQNDEVDSETIVDTNVDENKDEDEAAKTKDEIIAVDKDDETGVSTKSEQHKPSQNNNKFVYNKYNNKKKH